MDAEPAPSASADSILMVMEQVSLAHLHTPGNDCCIDELLFHAQETRRLVPPQATRDHVASAVRSLSHTRCVVRSSIQGLFIRNGGTSYLSFFIESSAHVVGLGVVLWRVVSLEDRRPNTCQEASGPRRAEARPCI